MLVTSSMARSNEWSAPDQSMLGSMPIPVISLGSEMG